MKYLRGSWSTTYKNVNILTTEFCSKWSSLYLDIFVTFGILGSFWQFRLVLFVKYWRCGLSLDILVWIWSHCDVTWRGPKYFSSFKTPFSAWVSVFATKENIEIGKERNLAWLMVTVVDFSHKYSTPSTNHRHLAS